VILISFISLFFITRQPITANVPNAKQYENRAETEPGPMTDRKKENIATVISEKEIDSELQKPLEITFDATGEKQMPLRHIVQAGDTLTSIARAYKTNVDAIINKNNLQNHVIYIGQILEIPFSGMDGRDRNAG
jgi:LysM repeat protein